MTKSYYSAHPTGTGILQQFWSFQRILAIAILFVCPSDTRVDQSKRCELDLSIGTDSNDLG